MNQSTGSAQSNPLREGIVSRSVPDACTIVIFGATGDLTMRKLIPAIYNIAADGELPPQVSVIGMARREKSDDDFRKEMGEAVRKFSRQTVRDEIWDGFAKSLYYHTSEFGDAEGYDRLRTRMEEMEKERGIGSNRLFYLAVAPDQFEPILENLKASGLNNPENGWARVIVEKPFGTDLATAKHLNEIVQRAFPEESTYRIDHFLGKETAQNILVLRFRECDFRAALEYALHRPRAGDGGGDAGRGRARRLLRRRGCAARHGAESSPATALPGGDGAADRSARGQRAR